MRRNYVAIHCDDLGMHQLLPTTEQISSNRSILSIIALEALIMNELLNRCIVIINYQLLMESQSNDYNYTRQ